MSRRSHSARRLADYDSGASAGLRRHPRALAVGLLPWLSLIAQAQTAENPSSVATEVITITGRAQPQAPSVAGFGNLPAAQAPFQASSTSQSQWLDAGLASLGEATRLDASISDAYNSPGYWAALSVRGFELNNRYNVRRDGLPISGETAVPLANKERLEVLKGTSGAQAGTSAPGGLLNLVVKRPRGSEQRSMLLGWSESGNLQASADLDQPLNADGSTALRLNLNAERLSPQLKNAEGKRRLLALAAQTRLRPESLLEAEMELSHQSQPSQPGFSLLGNKLPSASSINPRTNLNNQSWSQPVVFDGSTSSLRWTEQLSPDWKLISQGLLQRLTTDDRIAFPFGLYDPVTYDCNPCDRYASDGSFTLWDYRSEGEHRNSRALSLSLEGQAETAGLRHQLSTGLSWSDYRARLGAQTYNWAGVGQIDGSVQVPAAPEALATNTNRTERSLEWHLRDAVALNASDKLWLGLRHTRQHRSSESTDGTPLGSLAQNFTTPWLALSHQFAPELMAYASWGQGIEADVAPKLSNYSNAGQALPAARSRQFELGLKQDDLQGLAWSVTAFDIQRPEYGDTAGCASGAGGIDDCRRVLDGTQHHQGLEAAADLQLGLWTLHGSSLWLKARYEDASGANADLNGRVPTNVPQRSLRASATVQLPAVPGLALTGGVSHEGARPVLPDNSISLPGWTSWSLASRYQTAWAGRALTWRLGVDNLFDQRAWQSSPYQYSHAYLYPLAPRTFRASLQASL